jgi:hypothetical protein
MMAIPDPKDALYDLIKRGPVPSDPSEYEAYLETELDRIDRLLEMIAGGGFPLLHIAPPMTIPGMVVYADGTEFDPTGSTVEGLYYFKESGGWTFIA